MPNFRSFFRRLIAIGNVLFIMGLTFSIGWKRTLNLFSRTDRIRGTICFFLGLVLVLFRWGMVGMALETFGFLNLFGNFLPTVLVVGRQIPFLNTILDHPMVAPTIDYIAGKVKPKYSV